MTVIPEKYLEQFRNAGLLVSAYYPPNHCQHPNGLIVAKPSTVTGNSIPGFEVGWRMTDIVLDAPVLIIDGCDGLLVVTSERWVPGPGPGDFVHQWSTPEEVVADVLDFYFGRPERMQAMHETG